MKQWIMRRIEGAKEYYIGPRKVALGYALAVFIGLMLLWYIVGHLIEEQLMQNERTQVTKRIQTIGTSLTLAINQRLMITTSIHSFLAAEINRGNDLSLTNPAEREEVDIFISEMYNSTPGIQNIAIAPGGVMQYVYPYEENKSVLGYVPAEDDRAYVREEIHRAIQTQEIVLSLPYELIQGGQGLVARQAVYDKESYWGLANVVLNVPPLLEEAGVSPIPEGLNLALADQSGSVFFGSENIVDLDPITYQIQLPEGNWILVAIPSEGWGVQYGSIMWLYNGLGFIAMITIPLITYLFINRRDRLAYLVDQRTEELAQSNLTLINVLEGIDADVYVADIDTHEILFANKHLRDSFNNDLLGKICYQVFRHEPTICEHCMHGKLLDSNGEPTGVLKWEGQNPVTNRWYKNADRAIRWQDGRYVHLQIATDITEQKQAVESIQESEERYRNLFDSVPVGIYRSMPDGSFLDGNPALLEILGYDDQETMLASNIKDLFIDISARDQELDLIEQNNSVSNYRLKLRRYDGTTIWVQDSSTAVRDSSGKTIYYYGRLEDITGQVRAEKTLIKAEEELKTLVKEKDILLAEVHHRVKNNMQVIVSLLGLQASEIDDENLRAVYEESRNRIKSMTLVHEQLYRSKEYAHIEIGAYVDQLVTTLLNSYQIESNRIQIHITAGDVYIDLERAIPCGLLLNELITNSLKYAFPNDAYGQIWINLQANNNSMALMYRDDGIGLPAGLNLENSQSLGFQLIRLLTVHDLHGNVELKNGHKKGVKFHIKFPISRRKNEQLDLV